MGSMVVDESLSTTTTRVLLQRESSYSNFKRQWYEKSTQRERLMFFLPWRNEESLYGSFKTYKEHFKAKKTLITPVRIKYEQYNDVLGEAIEKVEQEDLEGVNDSEGEDINERHVFTTYADDYVFLP